MDKTKHVTVNLCTPWEVGETPLNEYPRPQLVRESYLCLNGYWEYAFSKSNAAPDSYDGNILVPFSPESVLSGVNRQLKPDEYLHYRKNFTLPDGFNKGRVILHFGAVDQDCWCYVNGKQAGEHKGGYLPFEYDITPFMQEGENQLTLCVKDVSDGKGRTTSKQRLQRGGIWYTATSGIWQTVWLESVEQNYIQELRITPNYDAATVQFELKCVGRVNKAKVKVSLNKKTVGSAAFDDGVATVALPNFLAWTPESPVLYDVAVTCDSDKVSSYFGMRKFSIEEVNGIKRICLNNQPYFMNGLLDQGYWSDGLYTAPTDEALYYDIVKMKELGFNTLRKHIKIEPLRWYYHCDRLGMLVWQDMPSGGDKPSKYVTMYAPFTGVTLRDDSFKRFARKNKTSRDEYRTEYKQMLDLLYNVTSIAVWVPFNEGWGQFNARTIAEYTKMVDSTRLVDHASGWHDQGGDDFCSLHVYFRKYKFKKDKLKRPTVLSEFGGYGLNCEGHVFNPAKPFGYKNFKDSQLLTQAFVKLYETEIIPAIDKGLCACIYTQVSDVEDEVNGILTYDRQVCKFDVTKVQIVNSKVRYE